MVGRRCPEVVATGLLARQRFCPRADCFVSTGLPGSCLSSVPAPGHNRSFPARSKISPRRTCEGQVSGDESEALVGSTRPLAVAHDRQLPGALNGRERLASPSSTGGWKGPSPGELWNGGSRAVLGRSQMPSVAFLSAPASCTI